MKSLLTSLSLFLALALTGCGPSESALVGKWAVDADASKPAITDMLKKEKPDMKDDELKTGVDMMVGLMSGMELEFKSDYVLNASMMGQSKAGKWSLSGSTVTITGLDGEDGTATLSGTSLTIVPGKKEKDMPPLVFKKKA
jgi:hypothetical protein